MSYRDTAYRTAVAAHEGQTRRDGVTPYIKHCSDVVMRLRESTDETVATAWLHDVLEDTTVTADTLRELGIPEPVVEAVQILTKPKGRTDHWGYMKAIKANPIARVVKIADMISNLADRPTDNQIKVYARGLLTLIEK